MKEQMVVGHDYLPSRLPFVGTCVVWLMLDRLHAIGWVRGAVWAIVGIWWVLVLVRVFAIQELTPPKFERL